MVMKKILLTISIALLSITACMNANDAAAGLFGGAATGALIGGLAGGGRGAGIGAGVGAMTGLMIGSASEDRRRRGYYDDYYDYDDYYYGDPAYYYED